MADTDEISPLGVLLGAMRQAWRDGKITEAVNAAKVAAPYVHARAGAAQPKASLRDMKDEQIDALCDGDGGEDVTEEAAR